MSPICLVHLVRHHNGPEPLREFLASYRRHAAGAPHDLLFILKGFPDTLAPEYAALLEPFPHQRMAVPDAGFDLGPYFEVVQRHRYPYYAFLNSFSTILCDGWLGKLYAQAQQRDVGAAGATGSWQSLGIDPARRNKRRGPLRKLVFRAREALINRRYPPFPNPHLRTNAFMASHDVLSRLRVPEMRSKPVTNLFESGVHGFTRQVQALGGKLVVVGCDGRGYDMDAWPDSATFWQRDQENLLVADNQTGSYARGDAQRRRHLAICAWGDRAEPSIAAARAAAASS